MSEGPEDYFERNKHRIIRGFEGMLLMNNLKQELAANKLKEAAERLVQLRQFGGSKSVASVYCQHNPHTGVSFAADTELAIQDWLNRNQQTLTAQRAETNT